MKISIPEDQITPEPTIDNKLEILKFTSQVQSRIKEDISEDFVLAKLDEKDKTGIIEMTGNAYFVKKIMTIIREKGTKWEWNNEKKIWYKRTLNPNERNFITKIANATFDTYLNRIFMTVILNRNVPKNYILKILAGANNDEEEEEAKIEKQETINKIQELIKPEKKQAS